LSVLMRLSVRPRQILAILASLLILGGLGLYLERKTIARRFADADLQARKVNAHFEIKAVGPTMQRIENLRIGDPKDPDLVADWVEIRLGLGLSGVVVRSFSAGGLKLRGKLEDGKLSFGAVDRLLPATSGEHFALPDMDVVLRNARVELATEYGRLDIGVEGAGNLSNGFSGRLAVNSPSLRSRSLALDGFATRLAIRSERRRIFVDGQTTAGQLQFGGNVLDKPSIRFTGNSSESIGQVSIDWQLASAVRTLSFGAADDVRADGKVRKDESTAALTARLQLYGARPSAAQQRQLANALPTAGGTPMEPLLRQLRTALGRLKRGSVAVAPVEYRTTGQQGTLFVGPPTIVAESGARVLGNGRGMVLPLDHGQASFDGEFALSGGGFPVATSRLALKDGVWSGSVRLRPFRAGGAQLVLAPVDFSYSAKGARIRTHAVLDGPLGSGRIAGLGIPISMRPSRDPLNGCFRSGFRSVDLDGLHLVPASFGVCISRHEARLDALRLAGRMGDSPLQLAANRAAIGFSRGDVSIGGLELRLGPKDRPSLLGIETLTGRFGEGRAAGKFTGAAGAIGNVPLKMSEGTGAWEVEKGKLFIHGSMMLADALTLDPRFNPMRLDDVSLQLANGMVTATSTVREPKTLAQVADVAIRHDLSAGAGSANLEVRGLTFGRALQPEMLTTTTLGVIANVVGTISGKGEILWNGSAVKSSGRFRTDGLDMAAAFGPVTGMKGEIALSDLLGLETGDGQQVTIGSINPGITVVDGSIRYQLLPGLKLRIEGGRWPFAGGFLILEPTMFDLANAAERRLTFRVEGMDAGQFINQLQFDNIDATGVYDGTLPMIFDEHGGRIEGGRLVARSGGTLAYVGEISNQNLGTMGRVAFDALKSVRYDRLSIDLDGPLDGDVVTRVSFAGVNQAPISGVRAKLPIPVRVTGLTNFPFIFNVTITAPFRKLFDMSRTISDPSLLIERLNPDLQRIGPAKTIQPPESERVQ